MTKLSTSAHTEKLGVAEVTQVCAKARTIFRPLTTDDIGIDGFLEVVEDGIATGIIAGVQIKSGDSFIDEEGVRFRFVSDQEHFGYWARCSFPVIGIVFSPKYNKSVWLDLTSLSSDRRIVDGPYSITIEYNQETAFTPSNLASKVVPRITQYTHQRRTLWQIRELIQPSSETSELVVPRLDVSSEKDEAWYKLTETLFAPNSEEEEIADAGYRLSWYFPSASESLQEFLKARFAQVDDSTIVRIIGAIHILLETDNEPIAELVVDLLRYSHNPATRIEQLLKKHRIPSNNVEAAIQVIEYLSGKSRPDLRTEARI